MKIKRLIMTLLIVFSLVPLYLVGGLMILANTKNVDKIMGQNLETLGSTVVMNIEDYCKFQQSMMNRLANTKIVEEVLLKNPTSDGVAYAYMEDLLLECKQGSDYVLSISLLDSNFRVAGATDEFSQIEPEELNRMADELMKKDFFIGNVYDRKGEKDVQPAMLFCVGIDRNGTRIGYIVEEISTELFDFLREGLELSKNDLFSIMDGNERPITAGYVGKKNYSEKALSVIDCKSYVNKWNKINHYISTSGVIQFRNGGTKYASYYSVIGNTDWMLRVTVNLNNRHASLVSYTVMCVLTMACVSLIMFFVNYILTRKVTQPIESIASTLTDVLKRNDYSLRIYVDKKGDLGEVSEQINRLLEYVELENKQDKQIQKQLEKNVELDPLTGILNKKAVHEDLEILVERANELDVEIAVGFVDVDNFRDFNTKYGHQVGDEVLKNVANCLKKAIPGVVGRNGGDEFLFCMLIRRRDDNLEFAMKEFYKNLRKGVECEPHGVLAVTCSVGVAHAKGGSLTVKDLEKAADEAMYVAKNEGKNTYHIGKQF